MKTSKFISALFVSSLLGVTACTPRDVKVVDENTRLKINAQKGGARGSQKQSGEFSLGNFALASFLMERQIEALEFVKLATGTTEPRKTQYELEDQGVAADGSQQVKISSSKENLEYLSGEVTWKVKAAKTLLASYALKNGLLDSVSVKGANIKATVDAVGKDRTYVNLVENYELTLKSTKDENVAMIEVKTDGTISGAKGGKNIPNKITVSLTMTVDKASLATQEVKILSVKADMTYPGPGAKIYNSGIQGGNLNLKMSGLCNVLDGKVTGSAGPKNKFDVKFEGEQISIGTNWTNKLAGCGQRPTVDLGRLQVY
ncbi:MAG: hypothetical protein KUL82_11570 [Bdellovibrio sp.]|nr:hypothetical protein [Bdellovibrio sp.]